MISTGSKTLDSVIIGTGLINFAYLLLKIYFYFTSFVAHYVTYLIHDGKSSTMMWNNNRSDNFDILTCNEYVHLDCFILGNLYICAIIMGTIILFGVVTLIFQVIMQICKECNDTYAKQEKSN
uniref:Uncharacterized protein n=1 Tax=viral metagenome TaxID=1070528 RepID=A0A6C0C9Z8_9ZZZZ